MDLVSKVALVTGAGRGIGRAIALALGNAGALVAVNDLDAVRARDTGALLNEAGHENSVFPADISLFSQVTPMIESVASRWGRLDILVNNAGVEPQGSILELSLDDWQRTLDVNLTGPFLTSRAVAPA